MKKIGILIMFCALIGVGAQAIARTSQSPSQKVSVSKTKPVKKTHQKISNKYKNQKHSQVNLMELPSCCD